MEPENREALIAQLSSSQEEERRLAMEALKGGLSRNDLQWLTRPLSDESWRVRKEAIEGLSLLPPSRELIASLVPLMDPDRELTLRNSVVEILERMGHEVSMLIVEHLHIGQADVRKFLVDILGNIANPETVRPLVDLLRDPVDNIRAAASEALAAVGDPSVCGELLAAVGEGDDWVNYSILGSLAQLGCRDALPVFFNYLDNQLLSKPALSGIGAMGSLKDGIRLMETVGNLSRGTAKSAFLASGCIYRRHVSSEERKDIGKLTEAVSKALDGSILELLISQLKVTDETEERKDILAVLGMSGSELSLEPVLEFVDDDTLTWDLDLAILTLGRKDIHRVAGLLNHHDPLVRQRGIRVLVSLENREFLQSLYGLLEDPSGHVRKDAATAVSHLGDIRSIDMLIPMLEDEYTDVAQSAARAIVHLGRKSPAEIAGRFSGMLETAAAPLYALLIIILAEVQAPGWEDLCLRAAQNTEPGVRAAAVSCLKRSGNPAAAAAIINGLADEDPQVRVQSAATLEGIKHPEAIDPLRAAMYDSDPWVRSSAVTALSVQPGAEVGDFRELLKSEDLMMQTSGLDALGRMAASGNRDAAAILYEQFEGGSLEMKRSVCRLLGKVGDPEAFELLTSALEDEDPGIRIFAVQALSRRGESAIPELLHRAGDRDPDKQVREAIRTALEVFK